MMSDATSVRFTGAYCDPIARDYPLGNGYRRYVPSLMRFNAPDELSPFEDGGPNPYVYCDDDPINYVDPTGHIRIGALFRFWGNSEAELNLVGHEVQPDAPIAYELSQLPHDARPTMREDARRAGALSRYAQDAEDAHAPQGSAAHQSASTEGSPLQLRAASLHHELKSELGSLYADMAAELHRVHLEANRPPSARTLAKLFFTDRRQWRELSDRRSAEFALREGNLRSYRARFKSVAKQMSDRKHLLDVFPDRRKQLKQWMKETAVLYEVLQY